MKNNKQLKDIVVGGELSSVCQMKGCWVTIKNQTIKNSGQKNNLPPCDEAVLSMETQKEIRVMFKDHSFSVPKNLNGDVLVKGTVQKKKLSRYQVKHFLKDLGCSKEQIKEQMKAIKKPIYKYQMKAMGLKTPINL